MTAPNLTREQATERAATLSVLGYRVELDLTDGSGAPSVRTFASKSTITFDATAGSSSFVDIMAGQVHSATLNGTKLEVSGYDEALGLPLRDLAEHNELTVVADCEYSHTGEGLHRFVDPTDDAVYLYSQF
ncbi:MAG: aminopeptidase N, partial [Mycobacteriaceae bacterium]